MTLKKKLGGDATLPPAIPEVHPPMTAEERVVQTVVTQRLYLPVGRGRGGKTLEARYLIERLFGLGQRLIIADADRTNCTLSQFYPGALQPDSADEADVVALVRQVIESMATTGYSGLIDFGGGDLILKRLAKVMDLQNWLPEIGITPVLLYLLGAYKEDLAFVASLEERFAPPATVVILNQAAVPKYMTPVVAFRETVQSSPILADVLSRGARLIIMPQLTPATAIEERLMSFADAAANRPPADGSERLGIWRAQETKLWLRAMDAETRAIEEWL